MPNYQSKYPNSGDKTRGKATRIICSWCKKVEKVGEEWERVGPISPEEKIGYRCCPACDTKTRAEKLRSGSAATADKTKTAAIP